jgi:hypothetical protein
MKTADLTQAYEGSFYTICGAGGELAEWQTGMETWLAKEGIGKPADWYQTTGGAVNEYAGTRGEVINPFKDDLTIIMFPLEGLHVGKLAIFKTMAGDRWFDDIVQNMVADAEAEDEE